MAKKVYHIPLQDARTFMYEQKTELNRLLSDRQFLEYAKHFGKGYYNAQVEAFVIFFKIDRDLGYALKTVNHFNGAVFLREVYRLLNFSQFDFETAHVPERDFFFGICYLFATKNHHLFETLMHKFFLHYHEALNRDSDIRIDYKEMVKSMASARKLMIRESFGEKRDGAAYFTLSLNGSVVIEEHGRSIKTLRKKSYRRLFYQLLDGGDVQDHDVLEQREAVYETLDGLKDL